jgi:hypothetical protein
MNSSIKKRALRELTKMDKYYTGKDITYASCVKHTLHALELKEKKINWRDIK